MAQSGFNGGKHSGRLKKSDKRDTDIDLGKKDPISVLIMGVDERKNDKGRADTMIYMTVNPKTNTTEMVSIPRDTYTKISGKGTMDKINHSYAFGGTQMAADTVEDLLDVLGRLFCESKHGELQRYRGYTRRDYGEQHVRLQLRRAFFRNGEHQPERRRSTCLHPHEKRRPRGISADSSGSAK